MSAGDAQGGSVSQLSEHMVDCGSARLKVIEQGEGPAVVLCHGFPGLAYSWRHQLPALAAAGYRAIAPDMRGYGGSDAPAGSAAYDRSHTVADMIGLLDALNIDEAVFVGHDFGAALVWDLPQWAPGRVRALVQLSVPRAPTSPILPSKAYARVSAKHWFHLDYFQEPGIAEAELDPRAREFLQRVFWALCGGYRYTDIYAHPTADNGYLDVLPQAPELPWAWLSEAEFDVYADTFARTGFRGGLNWYRANDHVWREKQQRPDEPVTVPVIFITGDHDPVQQVASSSVEQMREMVPGLERVHVIPGPGHFVQMEAPGEVNRILLDFLGSLA